MSAAEVLFNGAGCYKTLHHINRLMVCFNKSYYYTKNTPSFCWSLFCLHCVTLNRRRKKIITLDFFIDYNYTKP